MKPSLLIALIVLGAATSVFADGKMYWREKVPPSIPYQRALIHFQDDKQTMVLQSKFALPEGDSDSALGWVVPLPAVPEVASVPAHLAHHLFLLAGLRTQPKVTRVQDYLVLVLMLIAAGVFILYLASLVAPASSELHKQRKSLRNLSLAMLFFILLPLVLWPSLGSAGIRDGVDVISSQRAGIYDVQIVRSENSEALIAWLNDNQFKFGDDDKTAFDSYINRGWCFVVANISPDADEKDIRLSREGLPAPLILRFPVEQPVYPLALTATGGHGTEILIYLTSDRKMSCDNRLPLHHAGKLREGDDFIYKYALERAEPEGIFSPQDLTPSYICKFKGRMTPGEMAEDLVFKPAADNAAYRRHVVRW